MAPHDIVELRPEDPRPGARWFNRLLAVVRSCRLTVPRQGELELRQTPAGQVLSFTRYRCLKIAKNGASIIGGRSGTTMGSGEVTLYSVTGSALVESGTVTAYNYTDDSVSANAYLMLGMVDGYWVVVSQDC